MVRWMVYKTNKQTESQGHPEGEKINFRENAKRCKSNYCTENVCILYLRPFLKLTIQLRKNRS